MALGLSYEYADYSTNDMRLITGAGYDWYGDYYDNSDSDPVMKAHTQRTLKGVSTIKAGAEYKIDKNVAVRVGYNYVSPMYKTDGVRDLTQGFGSRFRARSGAAGRAAARQGGRL